MGQQRRALPGRERGGFAPDDPKAAIKVKDTSAGKSHWAWQPLKNPAVPPTTNPQWAKTTIDNFIVAKLAQKRMAPSPLADRAALIRRAYYDLVGLPPMPWEVQAFVDDKSPKAWENVIDRLLASPHYGERWGRYWLDVARYSDTKGESNKKDSPLYVDAWTYRDYVIDAFNKDKPYDRFIIEQLAADKLKLGSDKRPLAALGFLTVGDRFANKKDDIINDRIDTVSKAFLGLTVACARCHDHMFDPIPQKDYYSLHGVFASTAEPKDNPIIAAQTDAKLYQDYLKAREDATKGALTYVKSEFERVRKIFHQHAGDLLMANKNSGQDKRKYIEAVGGNAKNVGEIAQMVLRGERHGAAPEPGGAPFSQAERDSREAIQREGAGRVRADRREQRPARSEDQSAPRGGLQGPDAEVDGRRGGDLQYVLPGDRKEGGAGEARSRDQAARRHQHGGRRESRRR